MGKCIFLTDFFSGNFVETIGPLGKTSVIHKTRDNVISVQVWKNLKQYYNNLLLSCISGRNFMSV